MRRAPFTLAAVVMTIVLEAGWYLNPFRNIVLIGMWSATRSSITMTPFDDGRMMKRQTAER